MSYPEPLAEALRQAARTTTNRLWAKVEALPTTPPEILRARERAANAVYTTDLALTTDPTLVEHHRRGIDLLNEVLRQLKPLARQAQGELERRALVGSGAPEHAISRLGRTNPLAPDELDALSARTIEIADQIAAAALPDWDTPERIRERSERLMDTDRLEDIADQLRGAVKASLALPYPDPEAVRLAGLADQITGGESR